MASKMVAILLGCAFGLAGSCVSQSVQVLPELSLPCQVVDHLTHRPIAGAWITIVDRAGPDRGRDFYHGPFVTDAAGRARVAIRRQTAEVTGSDLYYRSAEVEAHGYLRRAFPLDTAAAREAATSSGAFTFDLIPIRRPLPRPRIAPITL